jgi:fluoride exporter
MNYLYVTFGAAIGGALRYWLSGAVYKILPETFPYGTFTVNFIGSFILGIIMLYFNERELISQELRLFLTVGFCGGFTTFSTFSLETFNLLKNQELLLGFGNILLNVTLCLAGIYIAYVISK